MPRRSTPAHDWAAAIVWGIVVAALTTILWIGYRHTPTGRRAALVGFGLLGWLVVVFFFFEAMAPLLPASY